MGGYDRFGEVGFWVRWNLLSESFFAKAKPIYTTY